MISVWWLVLAVWLGVLAGIPIGLCGANKAYGRGREGSLGQQADAHLGLEEWWEEHA